MITENMYQKVNINPPQVKVSGIEMLKIAKDGFYIKGVKLKQDDQESINVYNCFREWLTWATLSSDRDT